MATKSILIHVDDKEVEIVLKSARKSDGIWRAELMMDATKLEGESEMRKQSAFFLFPTCVASVKDPEWIREITFDKFMTDIDEADIDAWMAAAYELNPQWKTGMKQLAEFTAEEEKKTGKSASGSATPTEASKKLETSRRSKKDLSTKSPTSSSRPPSNT